MRNLKNVRLQETRVEGDLPLTATAWDTSSDSIVCTFGPSQYSPVIELRRKRPEIVSAEPLSPNDFECIASWDAPCPLPDLPCDRVLSLHYFADNLTACLVLEGGDIIMVREEPLEGEDKIEILGSVDVGISAAAWSPDEELLAITTRANTFLYMTREFENVAEITFSQADMQASQHVSVGWGKRETQFQGKRAKAMRDPTVPEKVDEGILSAYDDASTTISWRGDGAYVAVNTVEDGARRVIRVYSREGTLDSVSEPVDGLEGALSWRPSGNLIAGIQRLEDRIDVVFFERNGLRHGQFTLRLTEEERQTWASRILLSWNIDSTVLAVRFADRVQLWTTGNYHYYLKQEIPIAVDPVSMNQYSFEWHQEKALRVVAGSSGSILDIDYVFDIHHGSTVIPDDVGAVAVIDGKNLKLTPLRLAGVPPPMAHNELKLDSNVVDVAFSKSGSRIAVLMQSRFSIFLWSLKSRPVPMPILESSYPLSDAADSRPRQIAFVDDNEVYVLKDSSPNTSHIEQTSLETRETRVVYQASDSEQLSSMFAGIGHRALWFSHARQPNHPVTYSTVELIEGGEVVTPWAEGPNVDTHWAKAVSISDTERILITMTRTGGLYANKRVLAKNCTSFLVTPSHLLFTTSQHLLKFVHLNHVDDMEVPEDTPETDERCRSLERGSKLVSVMPSVFGVVLQAPRGNIETIYPRALVLAGIRTFIDQKKYRSAFLACRSQMVDLNILHDYAPQQFLDNIQLFVEQVKKVEFIDDFLSRLSEEDVSQTLYKDTLKISTNESAVVAQPNAPAVSAALKSTNKEGKINTICNAFLEVLQNRLDTNLQNLITAHVCKSPPDLEAGLGLVARLRTENPEQADGAIEHMCFLTDANRLYSHALGIYDLELTLLVAQQAQMDPREYLPFLRKLQQLPETRRQFEIDNHLSRFTKALKHLFTLGAHEEILGYVTKHVLYKEALEIYKYHPEQQKEITHLYADYLSGESKHKDAAIAYESLEVYSEAYKSYHLAHMWRESLYCAMMASLSEEELTAHINDLILTLEEARDFVSAATVYADHLHDIEAAAQLLCRGSKFADAARLLTLHGKKDLVVGIVDTGLAEAMGSMTDLLADCKSQLNAQVPRVRELRLLRAADPLAFYGGDPTGGEGGVDIPDNVSLAPTEATTLAGRTMFTRYTGKTSSSRHTSKTRRREERKRAKGKKGTVYEEEYLVNSIRRLMERVNSAVNEAEALVDALLRRGMRERAAAVEKALEDVLKMCADCREDVFEIAAAPPKKDEDEDDEGPEIQITSGSRVLEESMAAIATGGVARKEAPVVKVIKKSSLLA